MIASEPTGESTQDAALPTKQSRHSFVSFKKVLQRSDKVLLVGAPGSGKSVILAKLAIDMMREAFASATTGKRRKNTPIPILVTARQLGGYDNAGSLVGDQFGHDPVSSYRVSALLVDGLDEVKPEDREAVLEKVKEFAAELKCSVVVSTRWVEALREPISGFHQAELLEFRVSQAMRLFEKLLPEGRLLKSLREGLDIIQNQLHMTPLTLVLLVEVVRQYQEIPASITELYDRFFDYALGRHDPDKGIDVIFGYQLKKTFLAELAFREFYEKDHLVIARDDYSAFARGFCERHRIADMADFASEIERSNVVRFDDQVEFVHRSFLDYFVAHQLRRLTVDTAKLRDELTQIYFTHRWTEVTFFYVGIGREVDEGLIDQIFATESGNASGEVMKSLVGRLLQAGWLTETDVMERAIGKIVGITPTVRERLVEVVATDGEAPPEMLGDMMIVAVGGMSLGSGTLRELLVQELDRTLAEASYDDLVRSLLLLGALRNRLDEADLNAVIDRILGALGGASVGAAREMRLLAALTMISGYDEAREKAIDRRLRKMMRRNKELARSLFTPPRRLRVPRPSR